MALQGLDDLCDVEEDLEGKKVNLAVARLMEEKGLTKDQLNFTITSFIEINEDITTFIKNYLKRFLRLWKVL